MLIVMRARKLSRSFRPFVGIYLPKKFQKAEPKMYQNLITNTNRFTSTFDLYETLKDLTQMRLSGNKIQRNSTRVGRSMFENVPFNRNCEDAKVPENFCVCMVEEKMDTGSLEVSLGGKEYGTQLSLGRDDRECPEVSIRDYIRVIVC